MSTKSWGQRSIYFSMNKFHIPHSCNVLNLESPNQQKLWSNSCAPLRYLILCSVMTCTVGILHSGIDISFLWNSFFQFLIFLNHKTCLNFSRDWRLSTVLHCNPFCKQYSRQESISIWCFHSSNILKLRQSPSVALSPRWISFNSPTCKLSF